jgi:hypothetical protein
MGVSKNQKKARERWKITTFSCLGIYFNVHVFYFKNSAQA